MAEEEKASNRTESVIHIAPEFVEAMSEAIRSRRARPQDPEVEGHAMTVEQFNTGGGSGVICGSFYADN
jgi:hypothetical protein